MAVVAHADSFNWTSVVLKLILGPLWGVGLGAFNWTSVVLKPERETTRASSGLLTFNWTSVVLKLETLLAVTQPFVHF